MAAIQGPLTLSLHCSELVANVIRDERIWRKATTKGARQCRRILWLLPLEVLSISLLLAAKPLLHWMLGLAISLAGSSKGRILNFAGALLIFSLTCTIVALRRLKGPQPAAYGHVQTLANLIDEWSPTMWWGHKDDGFQHRHAGTCDYPLPDVEMDMLYA
ncbi:hypothetical protein BU15DRAFT_69741 [Melanogaster broomeanus]|nr:hypothetical protein BU15DRAFT_69741 [Melanogaster broomeanus]